MIWKALWPNRFAYLLPGVTLLAGGGSLFVAHDPGRPDGSLRQVASVEVRDAASPALRLEPVGEAELPASAVSLTIASNALHACLAGSGLATYDLADPRHPALTQRLEGMTRPDDPRAHVFLSLIAEPGRLVVADRVRGVAVYDAMDPLHPQFRWSRRMPGDNNDQPVSIERFNDGYYVCCGGAGLRRLPLGFGPSTESPRLLRQFDHTRQSLIFTPAWLLVADGYDTGLQILNTSDPLRPRLAHLFQTGTFCDQVISMEPYAIVSNRAFGFTVLDLHEPEKPFVAGYLHTPIEAGSTIKSLAIWRGRYLLASNALNCIDVYDLKNPRSPIHELKIETPGQPNVLKIEGDLLYASLWNQNRLMVYKIGIDGAAPDSAFHL